MSEMTLYDERDTIIAGLKEQLRQAREELAAERAKDSGIEEGVSQLRATLLPLKQGLDRIFGILPETTNTSSMVKPSAAWDSWKQRMGPNSAASKIIDLLMLHRELTHDQIRIQIGTNRMQTVYDAVSKLNKASLLVKNGDKFSLKEL